MTRQNEAKPLVLFVDHEEERKVSLLQKLEQLYGGKPKKRFIDHYRLKMELLNISPDDAQNAAKIKSISESLAEKYCNDDYPWAILVDLCRIHTYEDYETGINLATALKKAFPQVPVSIYTQVKWLPNAICRASQGPIDGMLDLSNLEQQADNLWDMLESYRDWNRDSISISLENLLGVPRWFNIEWEIRPTQERDFSVSRAAEALCFMLFRNFKDLGRLTLKEIEPGFSGTKLIKVIPYDKDAQQLANTWVMKIAEHAEEIEKLRRELEGYQIAKERMPNWCRPELYPSESNHPKMILDNWWAAFAMSFEEGYNPLINVFLQVDSAQVYKRVFEECLIKLYGKTHIEPCALESPNAKSLAEVIKELKEDLRMNGLCSMDYKTYLEDINKITDFLDPGKISKLYAPSVRKCFPFVHGDLNCRNIMVKQSTAGDLFKLIDFPNVFTQNVRAAATDFVKAELELLFLIMDYPCGRDIDPARLPLWEGIFHRIIDAQDVTDTNDTDDHLGNICECVKTIRTAYGAIVGREEDDWLQYRLVLFNNLLKYFTYKDLTAVKRAAAVIFARHILESLS